MKKTLHHPQHMPALHDMPSLFGEFNGWHNEMDRIFNNFIQTWDPSMLKLAAATQSTYMHVAVDVSETDKEYKIAAEMPGVNEKDIHIHVSNGTLTVEAEKKEAKEEKGEKFHRFERAFGAYKRQLGLATDVDESKITAHFRNGVLTITLPKTTEALGHTRNIEIQTS